MKHLALMLCMAGMLALTGCEDDNFDSQGDGSGGGVAVTNLQAFVLNKCNDAPSGDSVPINGASFPGTQGTDPANSVYTRRCMKS